jgi:uncharacterized protein
VEPMDMTYTFSDLAYDVLKQSSKPLTPQEIWQIASEHGLAAKVKTKNRTPWGSLAVTLYWEVRDNEKSKFIGVGKRPKRLFLKERQSEISTETITKAEKEEIEKPEPKVPYNERDLHPLLTYFAYSNPSFNRGRSTFTKTVYHEKSKKAGYNEWIHPDMVGFYLPLDDWEPDVIEFNRLCDNNSLGLFSFELKKSLNRGNYREAFFQAVSNSSWAHQGYLVAVDILKDDDFLEELDRLASSFGIGIIQLDPADIDSSFVLYPPKTRQMLDWETINKLCEQNPDFKKFLQDVKDDFNSRKIHKSEYDPVQKQQDIAGYIENKLKIKPETY